MIWWGKSEREYMIDSYNKAKKGFDFLRVQKVMEMLEWRWRGGDRSPTIEEMKETCDELFDMVLNADDKEYWAKSGGFKISRRIWGGICIDFVLTSSPF